MANVLNRWIGWGRALWILFALNSVYVFSVTLWVMWQILQTPSARIKEGLAANGLALELYQAFFLISLPVYFLTFFTVALLIYVQRPKDSFALFAAIFLVNFGATTYPEFAEFLQFYLAPPFWFAIPAHLSVLSSWTLLGAFLVLYPDGEFAPRWSWGLAAVGFFLTASWDLFPDIFFESTSLPGVIIAVAFVLAAGASLYVQFWRYRHHYSSMKRQQAKWFVFALGIVLISAFAYFFFSGRSLPIQTPAQSIRVDLAATITGQLGILAIPIAVGIAILRHRLWDIDIIIRRTLQYSVLSGLLALVYFGLVVVLQSLLQSAIGNPKSEIVIILSTLAIAALFNPLRRRVQDAIDRRFYRKKYDAAKVIAEFAATCRDETDLDKLTARLVEAVQETMQPERVTLWLKPTTDGRQKTDERNERMW